MFIYVVTSSQPLFSQLLEERKGILILFDKFLPQVYQLLEVWCPRRVEMHLFPGCGMLKPQCLGVKCLSGACFKAAFHKLHITALARSS